MNIPYDVFRNFSNQHFEDFLEDNNFRHCLWDERGWSDEEYWKLEKGVIELIELNVNGKYQKKINAILGKIIEVYFLMQETHGCSIYFNDLNVDNQNGYIGIQERIDRFKSLVLALLFNNTKLIKKSFPYSPNPNNPHKQQKLEFDKNKNLKHLTLVLEAPFSLKNTAYFMAGLGIVFQELSANINYQKSYYYCAIPYQIFLIIHSPSPIKMLSDTAQRTRKELERDCKILQIGQGNQKVCIYKVAHLDATILELYLSNFKHNELFFLRLGDDNSVLHLLLNKMISLDKLIQKQGGAYLCYTNLGERQTLEVKIRK
ncbi:hypothetical protein BBW65_05640 [Helicobacter enhydrae]|uniref:Uncharacterized protein n=1 Tax=Helicobacter enhydrae TaxID=222136 RepID=A0A1B1U6F5_9HELI|nr:Imm41 family immunity protein [Helicobacter enhydrae]ANV98311.1 hypothetical protein BBW65_05640 [Helicobacter enhydrae]